MDLSKLNVQAVAKVNKRVLAEAIFVEHYGKKQRKEVIVLFVTGASMTPAGASTYYQNFVTKYKKLNEAAKAAEAVPSQE